jgi:CO dehydrogenase/acetyl-CoA synthase epsilon subunit
MRTIGNDTARSSRKTVRLGDSEYMTLHMSPAWLSLASDPDKEGNQKYRIVVMRGQGRTTREQVVRGLKTRSSKKQPSAITVLRTASSIAHSSMATTERSKPQPRSAVLTYITEHLWGYALKSTPAFRVHYHFPRLCQRHPGTAEA